MSDLESACLFPVIRRQRHSPNVLWLCEFDTAMQRVLRIDINYPSRGTLIRQVDANRNSHSPTQPNHGRDQRSMKVDHNSLTLTRPALSPALDRNYHL